MHFTVELDYLSISHVIAAFPPVKSNNFWMNSNANIQIEYTILAYTSENGSTSLFFVPSICQKKQRY